MQYNTIHIFAYGETQVITDTENKKTRHENLVYSSTVQAAVAALAPEGFDASSFFQINVFANEGFVQYVNSDMNRFDQPLEGDLATLCQSLADELINY